MLVKGATGAEAEMFRDPEKRALSWCQHFRHCHCSLFLWQPAVPPVMTEFSISVFSGSRGQKYNCWCPSSLRRPVISSHSSLWAKRVCLPWPKISYSQVLSNSTQTPQTSRSRENYEVFVVRIWRKIDRFITAPRCNSSKHFITYRVN